MDRTELIKELQYVINTVHYTISMVESVDVRIELVNALDSLERVLTELENE